MAQIPLLKNERELLHTLTNPSNKNIHMICEMIDAGKAPRQIWNIFNCQIG